VAAFKPKKNKKKIILVQIQKETGKILKFSSCYRRRSKNEEKSYKKEQFNGCRSKKATRIDLEIAKCSTRRSRKKNRVFFLG